MTRHITLLENNFITIRGIDSYIDTDGEVIFKIPNIYTMEGFVARALCGDSHELLGCAIKYLRLLIGLDQEELANLLQTSRQTIIRWEKNGFNNLPTEVLFRRIIAEKLSIKELYNTSTIGLLNNIRPVDANHRIIIDYNPTTDAYTIQPEPNAPRFDHISFGRAGKKQKKFQVKLAG